MNRRDPEAERQELEQLRAGVSCAVLLERAGWKLDERESSRANMKYRRVEGEIVIVNHDGRGWWDPMSAAKGDVFALVRHLDPGLGFGQACDVLRAFMGLASSDPAIAGRRRRAQGPALALAERWAGRAALFRAPLLLQPGSRFFLGTALRQLGRALTRPT